mmetsp:Transcript_6166/g.8696  ORF Transcript_6166/g.8696 Transcript_6166/m.8696 type:complete len:207 (+) Transcript_6166:191-811(+)
MTESLSLWLDWSVKVPVLSISSVSSFNLAAASRTLAADAKSLFASISAASAACKAALFAASATARAAFFVSALLCAAAAASTAGGASAKNPTAPISSSASSLVSVRFLHTFGNPKTLSKNMSWICFCSTQVKSSLHSPKSMPPKFHLPQGPSREPAADIFPALFAISAIFLSVSSFSAESAAAELTVFEASFFLMHLPGAKLVKRE